MVKYSKNPDYKFEMLELSTMFDLDKARLVQAQINSINVVNNCANITLQEDCEAIAGTSVDEVKFFYFCDNSTGAEEDLLNGYKAFSVNDFVLCLWIPATSSVDEQFYIIGHTDIRGTKKCGFELLFLRTGVSSAVGQAYCLFNAASGELLDLEAFENIDEDSPAKPDTSIGMMSTDINLWIWYNFESVISSVEINYSMDSTLADFNTEGDVSIDVISENLYTGSSGSITGTDPRDCSAWFSAGNGEYSVTIQETHAAGALGSVDSVEIFNALLDNPFPRQLDEYSCSAAWGHSAYTLNKDLESSDSRGFIVLTDSSTNTTFTFKCSFAKTTIQEVETSLSGAPDFYAEASLNITYTQSTFFDGCPTLNGSYSTSSSLSTTFGLSDWPTVGTEGTFTKLEGNGDWVSNRFVDDANSSFISPYFLSTPAPILIGERGVYCVAAAVTGLSRVSNETGPAAVLWSATLPRQTLNTPDTLVGWGATIHYKERQVINDAKVYNPFVMDLIVSPFTTVSYYDSDFGAGATASLDECFANVDIRASIKLGEAITDMLKLMIDKGNEAGLDSFNGWPLLFSQGITPGVAVSQILKKKA